MSSSTYATLAASTRCATSSIAGRSWRSDHQRRDKAHTAAHDEDFQHNLLDELARVTGITLPDGGS